MNVISWVWPHPLRAAPIKGEVALHSLGLIEPKPSRRVIPAQAGTPVSFPATANGDSRLRGNDTVGGLAPREVLS